MKLVFTVKEERELEKYIKRSSDINYGLTYRSIQKLAYQYGSIIATCKMPQQWITNESAGKDWMSGFMRRHKELSLRKPESTSLARATGFNKHTVNEFFENYNY